METSAQPPRVAAMSFDWWRLVPLLGVVTGYAVLYTSDMGSAWGTYLLLAVALAFILPIVTAVTGGIDRLVLMAFVFALQFQLGFNPLYSQSAAQYKQAGAVGLYVSLVLLAAFGLYFIRVLRWLGGKRLGFPVHWPLVRGCLLFFAASALSFLNSPNKTVSIYGLWEIASLTLIAVIVGSYAATRDGLRLIHTTLLVTVTTQCLVVLAENALGRSFNMQGGATYSGSWEHARFSGTLIVPSVSATFVDIGLFFGGVRLFSAKPSHHRGLLTAFFGIGMLVLLLSLTRSAWIAFVLGGTGLGWYLVRHGTLRLRQIQRFALIGIVMMMIAWPALSGRLGENHSNDAEVRWNLVIIAMEMIKAHPLIGVGLNNATTVVRDYAARAGMGGGAVWVFIVHNQFMLVAAETGILGLAAFLWLFGVGIRSAYRAMRTTDIEVRDAAAATFWCLLAMIWCLNLDHVAGAMTYVFLFFLFGMASGLDMLTRSIESGTQAEQTATA